MQDRKLEFVIKDTALPYKQVFKSHHICHSNLIELRFRLYEKIRLLRIYMMSKRFIKCVFGRFPKEHTCRKGRI